MCLIPDIGCDFFLFCPEKLGQSFINFIDLFEELGFELLIKHFFQVHKHLRLLCQFIIMKLPYLSLLIFF